MSIEALAALGAEALPTAEATFGVQQQPGVSFEALIGSLEHLNTQLLANQNAVAQLALGQTDSLHHSVIGMEQTRLSFELMLAIRNKALDAYQELMRMQV